MVVCTTVLDLSAILKREKPGFNPLIATLIPHSNGPLYSNKVIGTLAVDE